MFKKHELMSKRHEPGIGKLPESSELNDIELEAMAGGIWGGPDGTWTCVEVYPQPKKTPKCTPAPEPLY